jgi:hypothetical protein
MAPKDVICDLQALEGRYSLPVEFWIDVCQVIHSPASILSLPFSTVDGAVDGIVDGVVDGVVLGILCPEPVARIRIFGTNFTTCKPFGCALRHDDFQYV